MMSATQDGGGVLVAHATRPMRNHIRRALGSMGRPMTELSVGTPLENLRMTLETPYSLYILEAGDKPEETVSLAEEIRRQHPAPPLLIISSDYRRALLLELFAASSLNHCIAKQGAVSAGLPLVDETELIVTCNKLLTHDIFDLSKYIHRWGIEVTEAKVRHTQDKDTVIADLEHFLDVVDCHSIINKSVLTTADELLMNAIFNAPRNADKQPKYAHRNRNDRFALTAREEVTIRYACDGRYIALSVSDNFGSLSRDVIFRYLRDSIEGRTATMESKDGGAGLGMHMLSNAVTQLIFNVHPGNRTEVIALFYVRSGPRAFREAGRSLNIFFTADITGDITNDVGATHGAHVSQEASAASDLNARDTNTWTTKSDEGGKTAWEPKQA
ncbi:MAG: hypothetical protein H6729_01760 [Deltaproteobacteria bacterium]|nr:hypothetical protein [Deltaproteobacteria bacterium]